jgi:DNA-binding NarL/FixJ family response regulator
MSDNNSQVFLVAESRLVREALGRVLSREPGIRVFASVRFDSTALARINTDHLDVLVLHLGGAPLDSFEIVAPLLVRNTNLRVVAIASDAHDGASVIGLGSHAATFVLQDPSLTEVILTVRETAGYAEHATYGAPETFFRDSAPGTPTTDLRRLSMAIGGPVSEPRLMVNCCDDWLRLFGKFVSEQYINAEEQT